MEQSRYRQHFSKSEKLCNKKAIDMLFSTGIAFNVPPFKVLFLKEAQVSDSPIKVLITAPKKIIRNAVTRNKVKRLIRETYRVNKYRLFESFDTSHFSYTIGFIYTSKKVNTYLVMLEAMKQVMDKLSVIGSQSEPKS